VSWYRKATTYPVWPKTSKLHFDVVFVARLKPSTVFQTFNAKTYFLCKKHISIVCHLRCFRHADINECANFQAGCLAPIDNGACVNTPGSFNCACQLGYQGDGVTSCVDVDECADVTACPAGELCNNTQGSFLCSCEPGFERKSGVCEDVDECATSAPSLCASPATCANTFGSYTCQCSAGYNRDDANGCVDIDECNRRMSVCGVNEDCFNVQGSYECS